MRIVIDMQGAQTESRFRGIGRYTFSLVQGIARNCGNHEVLLALSGFFPDSIERVRAAFEGLLPQENIRVWHAVGPVRECEPANEWRRRVAERIREAFIASLRPDVLYISSLFEGYGDDAVTSIGEFAEIATIATLYDLIPLLNPEGYLNPHPAYATHYRRKIEHLQRANALVAISEAAGGEGRRMLAFPSDAITNISTGCDAIFRPLDISEPERRAFLARFDIGGPFVLYSGGGDPRKNLPRLIRAYASLPAPARGEHWLVFAGRMPEGEMAQLRQAARLAGIGQDYFLFTGYVPDNDLLWLYNLCTVLVLPSLHEGFGLPALEAMSCGAAVIGADATSVPEVIGRQDALFDPYDEASIGQRLAQVLGNAAFRADLSNHGLRQARKFSWDESAKRAIAAFERVHSTLRGNGRNAERQHTVPELIDSISAVVPSRLRELELVGLAHALSCIPAGNAAKRLFLDVSELVQRRSPCGAPLIARRILNELLETPPPGYVVEPVCSRPEAPGYRRAGGFASQLQDAPGDPGDAPIEYGPGDVFLGLELHHDALVVQREYLAGLRRDGVRVFFVVHDLLPVLMPQAFPPTMEPARKAWLEIVATFDGALCISRAVAAELAQWLKAHGPARMRPFKIEWFHLGADIENSVPTAGLPDNAPHQLEQIARRRTFLMVGTVEPRKGHSQALSAFELLWSRGLDVNLVIVGEQGWMVDPLAERLRQHPALNERLFWAEGVSDEYLEKLYAASTCLIAASEGEGFGVPLIEAAQRGVPVIARDLPVFREVAGDGAGYFRGESAEALAEAITGWLKLYDAGQHAASQGMTWISWKQSAGQVLAGLGIEADGSLLMDRMSSADHGSGGDRNAV